MWTDSGSVGEGGEVKLLWTAGSLYDKSCECHIHFRNSTLVFRYKFLTGTEGVSGETWSDAEQLTGLMSLFSKAMKSSLLTCSFSAVSMFTSTVLVAYKHKHIIIIQVERQQIMSHFHSWMNSMAHLDCTMCQETVRSPQSRKVRPRGGREGGREEQAFRGVKRNVTAIRHEWDPLSVIYHHPPISAAPCVSVGAEHLADENFTLSV